MKVKRCKKVHKFCLKSNFNDIFAGTIPGTIRPEKWEKYSQKDIGILFVLKSTRKITKKSS
jgi:hypothetical protein